MNTLRATMRQLLLAGSLIALLPPVAIAYDFDTGLAAAQAGDCTTALEELRPLAEQGHADAQFNMGVMHVDGEGVPRDCAEGARWMRLAAEQGNALAQFALGALYCGGNGVSQDDVTARLWFNIGSANGSKWAEYGVLANTEETTLERTAETQRRARVCMESFCKDCD